MWHFNTWQRETEQSGQKGRQPTVSNFHPNGETKMRCTWTHPLSPFFPLEPPPSLDKVQDLIWSGGSGLKWTWNATYHPSLFGGTLMTNKLKLRHEMLFVSRVNIGRLGRTWGMVAKTRECCHGVDNSFASFHVCGRSIDSRSWQLTTSHSLKGSGRMMSQLLPKHHLMAARLMAAEWKRDETGSQRRRLTVLLVGESMGQLGE
jgi:hypothetical protein